MKLIARSQHHGINSDASTHRWPASSTSRVPSGGLSDALLLHLYRLLSKAGKARILRAPGFRRLLDARARCKVTRSNPLIIFPRRFVRRRSVSPSYLVTRPFRSRVMQPWQTPLAPLFHVQCIAEHSAAFAGDQNGLGSFCTWQDQVQTACLDGNTKRNVHPQP